MTMTRILAGLSALLLAPAASSFAQSPQDPIKRSDVGAIPFATIPAMIDKTGLKRTVLETDTLVYEGSADAVAAFETIAHGQGWNYYKSNKNC